MNSAVSVLADRVQRSIWDSPVELLYIISPEAEIVFHKKGKKDITPVSWEDISENFGDGVFIHNHPGDYGTGFSDSDVMVAVSGNCEEARVVATDRKCSKKKYLYVLRRPKSGWPVLSRVMGLLDRMDRAVKSELQEKVDTDAISTDCATSFHNHLVMSAVADVLKLYYKRFEFNA